jgi:hypothetical protein
MNLTDEDKNWILTQLAINSAEIRKHTAEAVEMAETKLLTAFHQWAGPLDARVKSHSFALRAFDRENEN